MTTDLLLLTLALQKPFLLDSVLVRKSGGMFKSGRKEQGLFSAVSGIGYGEIKRLNPFSSSQKLKVQIRMPKMGIPSTIPSQVPGNLHVLFHVILTFGKRLISGVPTQATCPCPRSLFLLVHFSDLFRFEHLSNSFHRQSV